MADGPERDEKTEEATARRREEARDKGQVAYSTEVVVVAMLCAGMASLTLAGAQLSGTLGELVAGTLRALPLLGTAELDAHDASAALNGALRFVLPSAALVVLPMVAVGLFAGFGQAGLHLAAKAVEIDVSKLDPVAGARKLFSPRSWMRTLLGALKIMLVGGVMLAVTLRLAPRTSALSDAGVGPFLVAVGYVLVRALGAALLVLVALAVLDLLFQRQQHAKDLRMTKKEVKDEARNTEGDPLVKSRIRQVQRELASRRMMQDVPDATVVVTNPTHVAVALRYDEGSGRAPVVVAKGLDEIALRIRSIAAESGVIVHEEPPLARALHRSCEIGDAIPAELFEAVARVLAYVYRVQGKTPVEV